MLENVPLRVFLDTTVVQNPLTFGEYVYYVSLRKGEENTTQPL